MPGVVSSRSRLRKTTFSGRGSDAIFMDGVSLGRHLEQNNKNRLLYD